MTWESRVFLRSPVMTRARVKVLEDIYISIYEDDWEAKMASQLRSDCDFQPYVEGVWNRRVATKDRWEGKYINKFARSECVALEKWRYIEWRIQS